LKTKYPTSVLERCLKALVVGYGSIGQRHISNLLSFPNIEILVCTNRKYDTFLRKKKCKIFDSIEKCLKEKPDFAIITNVTSLHIKTAIQLANSGINLLIEKPLSDTLDGVQTLLKIIKKRKLTTLMGCVLRFHPCIRKIKEIVSNDMVGRIISVIVENGSYLPYWHLSENYLSSYAAREDLGGGVTLTSIHEIDYLYWFFGGVKEVYSITGKFSDLELSVDDLSASLLRFKNNIIAEVHLDYFQNPSFRSCKIIGTKGTIYWNSETNTVKVYDIKRKKWIQKLKLKNYDWNTMYIKEIHHFLNCVKKKEKPINDVYEGAKVLKIALAIKKSSKIRKEIVID